jgi:hypothetical protein
MTQLDRIEQKLDMVTTMLGTLLEALADEDDEQEDVAVDLDGNAYGGPRNQDDML